MCDSNRIAHRGCIARFGPLRADLREGRVLGTERWNLQVKFVGAVFRQKSGLALPKFFCRKFRRQIPPQILPATFAGKFRPQISPAISPGKFHRQISPGKFRQQNISPKDPQKHSMVVILAGQFWVVAPKNLRNTKDCLSVWCGRGRAMSPHGKADGAGLCLGPRSVTDTKQNCTCYEHFYRICTLQKDQGPQDRIHWPINKISH